MMDKLDPTSAAEPTHAGASGPVGRSREYDLDRDRAASMADEGGAAGAAIELREELDLANFDVREEASRDWGRRLLWGALALGAAVFALNAARALRRG